MKYFQFDSFFFLVGWFVLVFCFGVLFCLKCKIAAWAAEASQRNPCLWQWSFPVLPKFLERVSALETCFPVLSSGLPEQRHVESKAMTPCCLETLWSRELELENTWYLFNLGQFKYLSNCKVTKVVIVILKFLPIISENVYWGFVLGRFWIPVKFGFFVVHWKLFLLLSRDQYLFKNRPTDGPPNSFYRSLYPKIIQDIEVGVLIHPVCRTHNGADVGVPKVVNVGAMNLCHCCSWGDVIKHPQHLPATAGALV